MKLFISIASWLSIFLKKLKFLFFGNRNTKANIFWVQANNSVMCGYFCIGFIDFMLTGKKLTDYTNLFSPHDFDKNDHIFSVILKMAGINKSGLSDQTKFRLSEITGIENYFYQEINQQKSYSKKLNKYVTIFDYIDKILIILSVTRSGISIISFASIIGVPAGITSTSFTLIFSIATGIIKKLLKITRKKNKRYAKIIMLTKSKLNSI